MAFFVDREHVVYWAPSCALATGQLRCSAQCLALLLARARCRELLRTAFAVS
jgi:hypothetical protein